MNEQFTTEQLQAINAMINTALEPFVARIAKLEAFKQSIAPDPTSNQIKAKAVFDAIPKDILEELKIVSVMPDPNQPWFQILRADQSRISVKIIGDNDFRIRARTFSGELIKEANAKSLNQFVAAMKALI
jgi:hypothetical protein